MLALAVRLPGQVIQVIGFLSLMGETCIELSTRALSLAYFQFLQAFENEQIDGILVSASETFEKFMKQC